MRRALDCLRFETKARHWNLTNSCIFRTLYRFENRFIFFGAADIFLCSVPPKCKALHIEERREEENVLTLASNAFDRHHWRRMEAAVTNNYQNKGSNSGKFMAAQSSKKQSCQKKSSRLWLTPQLKAE